MATTFRRRFGQRVRKLREDREMTQIEVADKLGFSRTYLAEVESGKRNPTLETIKVFADGFGITLERLFKGLR